jgi:choline-sulfatase
MNFILLLSDEHNPFFSGSYGNRDVATPNMDRLAAMGTVFENTYCPSPLCLPSRSAFMAGKRVHEIQTYSNCNLNLNTSTVSYAEELKKQGVYCVHIGKTDVFRNGDELGFDEMIMPDDRALPGDTEHRRNPLNCRIGSHERADGFGPREDAFKKDVQCFDEAICWLREKAPKIDKPWVLSINVLAPHFPHFAPPEFWEQYQGAEDFPMLGKAEESAGHPYAKSLRDHFEADLFTDEQVQGLRRGYYAAISFLDHQLGRLMDETDFESTNLAYASDHGEMLGKFGMWWKCSMYEDSLRVPLIAAGPDFAKNLRVQTPADLHDLRAAIFQSLETQQPASWLGDPLQQLPQNDPERVVFSEYHGHGTPGSSFMIRRGDWKYLWHHNAPSQLFNLADDPDERHNLAKQQAGALEYLHGELLKICDPEKEHQRAEEFIEQQLQIIEGKSHAV